MDTFLFSIAVLFNRPRRKSWCNHAYYDSTLSFLEWHSSRGLFKISPGIWSLSILSWTKQNTKWTGILPSLLFGRNNWFSLDLLAYLVNNVLIQAGLMFICTCTFVRTTYMYRFKLLHFRSQFIRTFCSYPFAPTCMTAPNNTVNAW